MNLGGHCFGVMDLAKTGLRITRISFWPGKNLCRGLVSHLRIWPAPAGGLQGFIMRHGLSDHHAQWVASTQNVPVTAALQAIIRRQLGEQVQAVGLDIQTNVISQL